MYCRSEHYTCFLTYSYVEANLFLLSCVLCHVDLCLSMTLPPSYKDISYIGFEPKWPHSNFVARAPFPNKGTFTGSGNEGFSRLFNLAKWNLLFFLILLGSLSLAELHVYVDAEPKSAGIAELLSNEISRRLRLNRSRGCAQGTEWSLSASYSVLAEWWTIWTHRMSMVSSTSLVSEPGPAPTDFEARGLLKYFSVTLVSLICKYE